jgi:D-sedoheptulose 7-phosphate isomerase
MQGGHRGYTAEYLQRTLLAMQSFADDSNAQDLLEAMSTRIVAALRGGHKLLIAGNGGSAADAQHIAAEFVSRLMYDRAPLAALALTTDSSALTAVGNDYGYEHVFARQLGALGRPGDIFLGISTSGRSPNIIRALAVAQDSGIATLGFCGPAVSPMVAHCDLVLRAPGTETAIIQQVHITAAHILCALVERTMFPIGASGD